jgi:hypothetical protein
MLLTKGQILKVERRRYRNLFVEELGGEIRIASISAGCGLDMKELAGKATSRELAMPLFTSSIVDENGAPMFDDEEAARFLQAISVETMNFIMGAITDLSGNALKAKASENGAAGAEVPAANPSSAAQSESSPTA